MADPRKKPSLRSVEERNRLVEANTGLAYLAAKQTRAESAFVRGRLTFEEAASVATVKLIRAAELWEEGKISPQTGKPVKFNTYAMPGMMHEIRRVARDETRGPHVPVNLQRYLMHLDCGDSEAAARMRALSRWKPKDRDIKNARRALVVKSLHEECDKFYRLDPEPDFVKEEAQANLRAILWDAIHDLEPREQIVLDRWFFRHETLLVIGKAIGVTRERVRQIKLHALEALRLALEPTGIGEC